jgi:hypothetical protein
LGRTGRGVRGEELEEERRLKRAIGQRQGRYLAEILLEHPEYGYRRVTEELHVSPKG